MKHNSQLATDAVYSRSQWFVNWATSLAMLMVWGLMCFYGGYHAAQTGLF